MKTLGLVLFLVMIPILALAQVVLPTEVYGEVDWANLITQLIANPKAFTAAVIGALVILGVVQATKKFGFKVLKPQVQFLVITILGQAYGVIVSVYVLKDQDISKGLIGLIASGGAAAIFNAFKLVFDKKPKPKLA